MGAEVVVVSHRTALALWRGESLNDPSKPPIRGSVDWVQLTAFRTGDAVAVAERLRLPLPLHVLGSSEKNRRNGKRIRCHLWNERLPKSSFVDLGEGVLVSAPELVVFQLANSYSLLELVLLVSEFGGRYALSPTTAKGFWRRGYALASEELFRQVESRAFHMHGRRKLSMALDFAVWNSWSPMETILALLLSLPVELGGFALPKPVLNPKLSILVGDVFRAQTLKGAHRYGDLVWPEKKLIVEYDSAAEHQDYARDSARANALSANGWTVVTVLPADVFDANRFSQLASNVATILDAFPAYLPTGYAGLQMQLRSDLFTACGTRCRENRNWHPEG